MNAPICPGCDLAHDARPCLESASMCDCCAAMGARE